MKILSIDVSISGCSVAYIDIKKSEEYILSEEMDRGQAERLIPMIGDIAKQVGFSLSDLERIAVTRGPGSFTGVRVGLAAARALGMALHIPVLGFSSLEMILKDHPNSLVAVDTKRGDYYGQDRYSAVRIYTQDEINAHKDVIKDKRPDTVKMARYAATIESGSLTMYPAEPIYVRDAETSTPKGQASGCNLPSGL